MEMLSWHEYIRPLSGVWCLVSGWAAIIPVDWRINYVINE